MLDRLEKIRTRFRDKPTEWPVYNCTDVGTHLAGMFLREHIDTIIKAVKRLDDD